MKLRLSTKYIRTRVAIWVCSLMAIVFFASGIKIITESKMGFQNKIQLMDSGRIPHETIPNKSESHIDKKAIYLFILGLLSGLTAFAGFLTYKEKFYRLDKKRDVKKTAIT